MLYYKPYNRCVCTGNKFGFVFLYSPTGCITLRCTGSTAVTQCPHEETERLSAWSQGCHEQLHLIHEVAPFHFIPLDFLEGPSKMVPFVVLQHVAFGEIFALTPWKLNHNFAATFRTITYWNGIVSIWWCYSYCRCIANTLHRPQANVITEAQYVPSHNFCKLLNCMDLVLRHLR